MRTWDVVVVGAGPGGAVAAHAAARSGASVLLVDRSRFPRWKVCGACLSPGALAVLRAEGLGDCAGGVPLRAMALAAGGRTVRLGLDGSVALSRTALDEALATAAVARGAEFWPESRASLGGVEGGLRLLTVERPRESHDVGARVVIDATGLGRRLPAAGGRASRVSRRSRVGLGATFRDSAYPVAPGVLSMAVGRSGYVGLVRVEDGALNVAAAVDPSALKRSSAASLVGRILGEAGWPALESPPTRGWRGTPQLTQLPGEVGAERLLRLGDAAGYIEPFTGEGMCWAVGGARVAVGLALAGVDCWHADLLSSWEAYHRGRLRRAQLLCRALASALRYPRLVATAVSALGMAPGLARPFVKVASSAPPPLVAQGT